MRTFDKTTIAEEELQDLKLRYELLGKNDFNLNQHHKELLEGERKAYYENSQWTVRQNKDEITRLKSQNKQLHEEINVIRKKV